MRVFAITQGLLELTAEAVGWFEDAVGKLADQILADGRVVAGRHFESTHGVALTHLERDAFVALEGSNDIVILGWVDNDGDAFVVFGRSAHHGWAADIDVFDGGLEVDVVLGDGFFKWIKIDGHQVDWGDVHFF